MRRSVFGCYAMLIVTAQMAGGEELRPERLRVLVPELPREYRPTEVARVFGSLAVAKHSNAVSPATGLRTVVFLDTANASARELVCTLAEWMAVPALQAPETPVFTSGGFSFPGFQTVPSPDQNYTVVADPDVFRRTVSDLCREARAMRPMKAWGLDYYRPTYSDSRPAFWNWLRTQPPTRVFWISRSFGWMEPIVEWVDDGTGNYGISASADESEWVWVRRLPGLSQHAIFPIFMSGVVQESRPIPDAQNPEQPQPAGTGPGNAATRPASPPPPRPRGSERRDYRHALQFAVWFGGAVYEAKSRAGDALAEALRDSERMRLVDFSVLCPPRGKPIRGPVAVAMPGFPVREWSRGAACGGDPKAWHEPTMDPAQLVLNNREIEPCVSCAEQKEGIWRVGLRLPKALASVGRWESFLLDARRNPEDQWMTRRSPWVSQRVTRDSLVFLDLPKGPVRRHAVMLLRKPGSEHVAAVVLDIVPSPAGKP